MRDAPGGISGLDEEQEGELFAVEASKVLKLPAGANAEHGAMIGPVAVAVHALGRAGDVLTLTASAP